MVGEKRREEVERRGGWWCRVLWIGRLWGAERRGR